jgi:hypothetical protein
MADALATPEVDIDLIDVVDKFNARQKFPKEELEELAGTITDARPSTRSGNPPASSSRLPFEPDSCASSAWSSGR